ncbi:ABC transporter substrate-binding protein [Streptosporangium sp. NPDC051022]|uniref:ABC transporter substrate-binding protein n=1 Tax=Streptosporangium sp. NPDC051022 TaxID=3155752 RepID=UPI003430E18F
MALLAATAVLTSGCGGMFGGDSPAGQSGGDVLRVAIGSDPGTVDPAQLTSATGGNILWEVTQTLTTSYTPDGRVRPLLAESWQANEDSTAFTFKLRTGVSFSDGTPFTAEAVKFTMDRLTDESVKVPYRSGFANLKSTEIVNDHEVVFHLAKPNSSFPGMLGRYIAGILSPTSVKLPGNSYENIATPIGTGPYTVTEYRRASKILLARNERYWGDKPGFPAMEWQIVPEASSREALIKAGNVDVVVAPPPSDLASLKADRNLQVLTGEGTNLIYGGINMVGANQKALKDVRVRQALNLAIDRQGIIDNVLFGLGDPARSPAPPALANACETGDYGYDPARAKALLKEAGAEGITVKLTAPTGRYMQDFKAAQAIAGNLTQVGVKVEGPTTSDWSTYIKDVLVDVRKAGFDIGILGAAPPYPDASETLAQTTSDQIAPNGLNFAGWVNKEFDAAVAKGRAAADPAKQAAAYCEAEKLLWNDAPWLFLWTERTFAVARADVGGLSILPTGVIYLDGAARRQSTP